jgi:PAS domain S-box-containing protein
MAPSHSRVTDDSLLQTIMDGTAAETGSRFFRALVKNLSQALGTHGAWVTEYHPETRQLRALAFWLGSHYVEHYEYDIEGTPCEPVIQKKTYQHIPEKVVELFPGDPDLPGLGAVSYMGFPLLDTEQNVLGNLAVLDIRPMPESFRNLALFRIFAARATAELLRMRAEAAMQAQQEKLQGLFDGAMDAIIELDRELDILMMNPSAERLFGCARDQCIGKPFIGLLTPKDTNRLRRMAREMASDRSGRRSLWIPEGLNGLNAQGKKFPVEATLSLFEMNGIPCYVLILRDVNELYEAQKTIESLRDEAQYLRDEIQAIYKLGRIVGDSHAFRQTLLRVAEVAPTDSTVLISGDTGTGKELIARAIHAASLRKDRPLITVNCAAIPDSLMESEFFGHEKGAFTGATQRREGRFGLADGGTIFLDEVGELNKELQAKLLRVLQEGEFSPVGSSKTHQVDVRVIAATNRDLATAVQDGQFRTDLYYRLNVFPMRIPPLRERGDDIVLLAAHFVDEFTTRMGRHIDPLGRDAIERLKAYDWPGNVRELQNVIERGIITARRGRLNLDLDLPRQPSTLPSKQSACPDTGMEPIRTAQQLQELERDNLVQALQATRWRVSGKNGAAQLLGMPPSTLQSRMKALGIKRPA